MSEFFARPGFLLLLLIVLPLAGLAYWWSWHQQRRDRTALGDPSMMGRLLRSPALRTRTLRAVMMISGLALIVVALARPQIGAGDENMRRQGLQVMIVLDTSLSMAAQDVQPSRFEAARDLMLTLFNELDGSQFGLVVFGETSHVQFPLTSDMEAARTLVKPLTIEMASTGGSNVGVAIDEALQSFVPGQTQGRIILLLTDGGDPEQDLPPGSALQAAQRAGAAGVQIHTVGLGTPAGARVPKRDEFGRRSYVQDSSGNEVVSKLNEQLLSQVSSVTGGSYHRSSSLGTELEPLLEALERGAPVELTDQLRRVKAERFQIVLGLALLLLAGEYVLLGRRGDL